MINFENIWKDKQHGDIKYREIDFQCENCKSRFSEDAVDLAVFLYGFFFFHKNEENTSYIKITCPSCINTILIKENRFPASLFNKFSSQFSLVNMDPSPKLTYFTSIYHHELLSQCLPDLRSFNINYNQMSISENGDNHISSELASYVFDNNLDDHFCSFFESGNSLPSINLFVIYIEEQHIEDLVKYEQENNVRIIPRYMHHLHLFGQIETFCARYGFDSNLGRLMAPAKANLKELERIAEENNWDLDEMILNDPAILTPEKVEILIENEHPRNYDFGKKSDLMSILAADPYPWDFQSPSFDWIRTFWKRPDPFKDQDITLLLHDLNPFFKDDQNASHDVRNLWNKHEKLSEKKHKKMTAEIQSVFEKGYIQTLISKQYSSFIKEYRQIVNKYAFFYADIWELKERYLEKVYKCVEDKKSTRPSYRHRKASRQIAKDIWAKNPEITIADMIRDNEIANACDGKLYDEGVLRKWIKDLCPNRKPGRRPKKK